jgi:hypothetical protein
MHTYETKIFIRLIITLPSTIRIGISAIMVAWGAQFAPQDYEQQHNTTNLSHIINLLQPWHCLWNIDR